MLVLQIATAEFMILYRGSCTVGRVARAVAQRNAWLPVLDGAFGATVLSWSAVTFVLRPAKDASRAYGSYPTRRRCEAQVHQVTS